MRIYYIVVTALLVTNLYTLYLLTRCKKRMKKLEKNFAELMEHYKA